MRDVFAVIKLVKTNLRKHALIVDGQEPLIHFRCYIKGGGAYDERGVRKKDDKNIKKIPIDESNNRVYLAIFAKKIEKFLSLY